MSAETISYQLLVTYLQKFINFNLPVLVEVHLIQNFMQRVFINLDVDALQRNTRAVINNQSVNTDRDRQAERQLMTHIQDLLNVHSGDESFPVFVELVETLLVSVTQKHVFTFHLFKNQLASEMKTCL